MSPIHLFEKFGIELEYMIVNSGAFSVFPAADLIFKKKTGWECCFFDAGRISWSNELALHVIELKTSRPDSDLATLFEDMGQNVKNINNILKDENGRLMPTSCHPFMDPDKESILWPHEFNDIYLTYDAIFGCKGHGWTNLQSTHINLPFHGDDEFGNLHAAVRIVLPLLPALCASSPIINGKRTEYKDTRMHFYDKNQQKIPSITGPLIPEAVYTEKDYERKIFSRIMKDIDPFDKKKILNKYFLNSRAAIARFDRGSLEIRIMDIQESPLCDLAVCYMIILLLKKICAGEFQSISRIKKWKPERLKNILVRTIKDGEYAPLIDREYREIWGDGQEIITAGKLWENLYSLMKEEIPPVYRGPIENILTNGTLATRIVRSVGENSSPDKIKETYGRLCDTLNRNTIFTV